MLQVSARTYPDGLLQQMYKPAFARTPATAQDPVHGLQTTYPDFLAFQCMPSPEFFYRAKRPLLKMQDYG